MARRQDGSTARRQVETRVDESDSPMTESWPCQSAVSCTFPESPFSALCLAVSPSRRLISSYWRSYLLQQAGGVHLSLELDHLSAVNGEEGDAGELHRLPGWGEAKQIAVMRSPYRPARGDPIALGNNLVEGPFQVGECGHEISDPSRPLGDPGRVRTVRRPVQVPLRKDLRHDVEVPCVVDLGTHPIDDGDRLLRAMRSAAGALGGHFGGRCGV